MPAQMTLRERVRTALKGELPDQVPFTSYASMVPSGEPGQALRALGLAAVRRVPPYWLWQPHVEVEVQRATGTGYPEHLVRYRTPVGTLTQRLIVEPGYGSQWRVEHLVKQPEDYAVLEFIVRDTVVEPDMARFRREDAALGDDGIALAEGANPPVQELWRRSTGMERFVYDWQDCRDQVQRVLDAMAERNPRIWEIVAEAPSEFCASGGNISGDLLGPDLFAALILPHFEAEAQVMRPAGKTTLNHMDGMLRSLLGPIARCPVHVVEAFNPAPDGNVSVAEARAAWPGKAISINFPSSIHLAAPDVIRQTTVDLLRQAAPGRGFVVGITENVPADVIEASLRVIAETLNECGRCPIDPAALPTAAQR